MKKIVSFVSALYRNFQVLLLWIMVLWGSSYAYAQCEPPTHLTTTALSNNTAMLSWTQFGIGEQTVYDYVVSKQFINPTLFGTINAHTEGVILYGNKEPLTITQLPVQGLEPSTLYYVLLRQNCEWDLGGQSQWLTYQFTTLCSPQQLPIETMRFDEAVVNNCWSVGGVNLPIVQSEYRYGDSGYAVVLKSNETATSMLYSPGIFGPSDGSEMEFKIYATVPGQRFSVGIADWKDINNSLVPILETEVKPGQWQDVYVQDASGIFTDGYVWVIYTEAGQSSTIYVDDVTILQKETCVRPEKIQVYDITASEATFAWQANGSEQSWNIELTPQGGEPIVIPVSSNPFTYTQLSELTTYSVRIQAGCQSKWSTTVEFTTLQTPSTVPYTCGFEEGDSKWQFFNKSDQNQWAIGSATKKDGSQALYMTDDGIDYGYSFTKETHAWAATCLQVDHEASYLVSFDWIAKGENSAYDYMYAFMIPDDEELVPGESNGFEIDQNSGEISSISSRWIPITTKPLYNSNSWQTQQIDIRLTQGAYKLVFYWYNDHSSGYWPAPAVDNVSITEILCARPELPTCKAINPDNVSIEWAQTNTYNIRLFTSPTDDIATAQPFKEITGITESTYQIVDLKPQTTYYLYAQTDCGTDGLSNWTDAYLTFTTPCASLIADDLPYFVDFEDLHDLDHSIPDCWTLVYSDSYIFPKCSLSYDAAYEGQGLLAARRDYSGELLNAMVAIPAFEGSFEDLTLAFYARGYDADALIVGILENMTDTSTFVSLDTVYPGTEYQEMYVDLSAYTGPGKNVAFKYKDLQTDIYIDNVRLMPTPNCWKPQSFSIIEITSSTMKIIVKDNIDGRQYDIEYGQSGFELGTGTSLLAPLAECTLTGLAQQTKYDVYVRARCGDDEVSEWLVPQSVRTLCDKFVMDGTNDFFEGFETCDSDNPIPVGCWNQESTNSNAWKTNEDATSYGRTPYEGKKNVTLPYNSDAWLYQTIHFVPGDYEFSCYARHDIATDLNTTLTLAYGTDLSAMKTIVTTTLTNQEYQLIRGEFTITEAGDYLIGLHGKTSSTIWYVSVDNISIRPCTCTMPQNLTFVSATDVSADINWQGREGRTYNIKVFSEYMNNIEASEAVFEQKDISVASCTVTGLSELATYYVYLQSNCGAEKSSWTSPLQINTECTPIGLPYIENFEKDDTHLSCWNNIGVEDGIMQTYRYAHTGVDALRCKNVRVVLPRFDFGNKSLSDIQISGYASALSNDRSFSIGIMKSPKDIESYMKVRDIQLSHKNSWREFICTFQALEQLENYEEYQYIVLTFSNADDIYLDDIIVEEIPLCPKPSDVMVSTISSDRATITWMPNGQETSWEVIVTKAIGNKEKIYQIEVDDEPTTTLTSLESNTTYEVSVNAICVDGTSAAAHCTFTTLCSTFTLPLIEDFERGLPDCWDNTDGTTIDDAYKWSPYEGGYESATCLRFDSYSNPEGNSNYLKTPCVSLERDSRLKFMAKKTNSGPMAVYVSLDGGRTYLENKIATIDDTPEWTRFVYPLTEYTGRDIVVVFEAISNYETGSPYSYIDDVIIEEIPACDKPDDVRLTAITTATSAQVTVSGPEVPGWDYVVGPAGFDPNADEQKIRSVDAAAFTITGDFRDGEKRHLYVRSNCADQGTSLWCGPVEILYLTLADGCTLESTGTYSWQAVDDGGIAKLQTTNAGVHNSECNVTTTIDIADGQRAIIAFDYFVSSESADHLTLWVDEMQDADFGAPSGSSGVTSRYTLNIETPGSHTIVWKYKKDGSDNGGQDMAQIWNVKCVITSCQDITALTVRPTSSTSASLLITDENNDIQQWEYLYGEPGFNPDRTENILSTPTRNVTINQLEVNHEYEVYARAVCAPTEKSPWYGPVVFRTPCDVFALPIEEGFEEGIPYCWQNTQGTPDNNARWEATTLERYVHSGLGAALIGNQSAYAQTRLVSPLFTVEQNKDYRVSFWIKRTATEVYDGNLNIKVLQETDENVIGTVGAYFAAPPVETTQGIFQYVFEWTPEVSQNVQVVFEAVGYIGGMSVDDITIEEIPACERPEQVYIGEVTATTVEVSVVSPWATQWEWVIGEEGFEPNAADIQTVEEPTTTFIATGDFSDALPRHLYVRSVCEDEEVSPWYGPLDFKYTDWTQLTDDCVMKPEGQYPWELIDDAGIIKAQSTNQGMNSSSSDIVTAITVEDGQQALLTFDYYVGGEGDPMLMYDYLCLYIDVDEPNADNYYQSFGRKADETGISGQYTIAFHQQGIHTIRWRYVKDSNGDQPIDLAQIWNVTVEYSYFFAPQNMGISEIADTSVRLAWQTSRDAQEHQVQLKGNFGERYEVTKDDFIVLDDLLSQTAYSVRVRSINGNDTTDWTDAISFVTLQTPVKQFPYMQTWEEAEENANWTLLNDTENAWLIGNDADAVYQGNAALYVFSAFYNRYGYLNNYSNTSLAYRTLLLEKGAYSIDYTWKANGERWDYLQTYLLPAEQTLHAGVRPAGKEEGLSDSKYGVTEWQQANEVAIVDHSGYYNLVFVWNNDQSNGHQPPAAIDSIVIKRLDCPPVIDLELVNVVDTAMYICWKASLTEEFQIACVPAGTDINTVSDFIIHYDDTLCIDKLTPHTTYDVYVRSVCDSETSIWTSLQDITTTRKIAALPYMDGFENTGDYDAWVFARDIDEVTEINKWVIGNAVNNGGLSAMYISNTNGLNNQYDTKAATKTVAQRLFYVPENGRYIISFDWRAKGEAGTDFLRAYVGINSSEIAEDRLNLSIIPGSWRIISNIVDMEEWVSVEQSITLDEGLHTLIFQWNNNDSEGTSPAGAIDNVYIRKDECVELSDFFIKDVTYESVSVLWDDMDGTYEWRIDTNPLFTTMTSAPEFSGTTENTFFSCSGLASETYYYVAIRKICAEGLASKWKVKQFKTACGYYELPFREDFAANPATNDGCWTRTKGLFVKDIMSMDELDQGATDLRWKHVYDASEQYYSLSIYGTNQVKDWLISPSIVVSEDWPLRFDLTRIPRANKETGQVDDKFMVVISTDNGKTWNKVNSIMWDNQPNSIRKYDNISQNGETVIIPLTEYVEDTVRIAFYGESTRLNGENDILIDNIAISNTVSNYIEDSICAGIDYISEHFEISSSRLFPGQHHIFSTTKESLIEGQPDQVYTIDLYVYPSGSVTLYDTICPNEHYTRYGFDIPEPQTRTYISPSGLKTVYGCDSTVNLHLYVPQSNFVHDTTVCENELPFMFGTQQLTESGTFVETFDGMMCDSTVTLYFAVIPAATGFSDVICVGDSIEFPVGTWRKTEGEHVHVYTNVLGCDSTVTLHLTVHQPRYSNYREYVCAGDFYSDNHFNNLSSFGVYYDTIQSLVTDCDSIIELTLVEVQPKYTVLTPEICEGEVYTFNGNPYTVTCTETVVLESMERCDSIVTMNLTVLPIAELDMELELLQTELPYSFKTIDGEVVYTIDEDIPVGTSNPEIKFENGAVNGCDSIINLILTIVPASGLNEAGYQKLQLRPTLIERGGAVTIDAEFTASEKQGMKIDVYNTIGQCVATVKPTAEPIVLDAFHTSGVYLVKLTCGNQKQYVGHVVVK